MVIENVVIRHPFVDKYYTKYIDFKDEYSVYKNQLSYLDPQSIFTPVFHSYSSNVAHPSNLSNSNLFSITISYVGPTWNQVSTLNMPLFVNAFNIFLQSFIILQEHQLIHGDIKPTNLTYDIAKNTIKIIDFGWCQSYNYLYNPKLQCTKYLSEPYMYFPPEYKITSYFLHIRDKTPCSSNTFYNYYIFPYLKSFKNLVYEDLHPDLSEIIHSMYETAKNMYVSSEGKSIYIGPYNTIDSFGLGISLWQLLLRVSKEIKLQTSISLYKKLIYLAQGLAHPNPYKRWTLTKAIEFLNTLNKT